MRVNKFVSTAVLSVLFLLLCLFMLFIKTKLFADDNDFAVIYGQTDSGYLKIGSDTFELQGDIGYTIEGEQITGFYVTNSNTGTNFTCTVELSETPGMWTYSCGTVTLPEPGLYKFNLYTEIDEGDRNINRITNIDYNSNIHSIWSFDNSINPFNEIINDIPASSNGDLSISNGILDTSLGGYINYLDEDGRFSFSNPNSHFKVEADIYMSDYPSEGTYRLIGKYNQSDDENTWTLGLSEGGVYCAVWIGETQYAAMTWDQEKYLLDDSRYIIGCEWNPVTREITASMRDINNENLQETTIIAEGTDYISNSTNFLTINGRPDGDGGLGADINEIRIFNYIEIAEESSYTFNLDSTGYVTDTETLDIGGGIIATTNISSIQYRKYQQGQGVDDNWSNCSCDDDQCDSTEELFTCNIENISPLRNSYELRSGSGDPTEYTGENSKFEIMRTDSDSILSWWRFDKEDTLENYSQYDLTSSTSNIFTLMTSPLTNSSTLNFDGDSYFDVEDNEGILNFSGENDEFTINMLIKPEEGLTTDTTYWIMSRSDENWGIYLYVTENGDYRIGSTIGTGDKYTEIGSEETYLNPGEWNSIIYSFSNEDFTSTIKINDQDLVIYSNFGRFYISDSISQITIGADSYKENAFVGEIDDIFILNYADTRAPQVSFTQLESPTNVTNPNQEFELTVTDETGVQSLEYLFYDSEYSQTYPETPISDLEWTSITEPTEGQFQDKEIVARLNAPNLQDGRWYLYVRASDINGFNTINPDSYWYTYSDLSSPSVMPYTYFIIEAVDTTAPQIFAQSIVPQRTIDTNPGIRGYVKDDDSDTISDIASIEYKLESGQLIDNEWQMETTTSWLAITPLGETMLFDSNIEEFYLVLDDLEPGDYRLEIRASDTAGNNTEDSNKNNSQFFTIYEIEEEIDTTVLVKEESFADHSYHDLLFSNGVWGNGILRLRQQINFEQTQELYTNHNDFGFKFGKSIVAISQAQDGNIWLTTNDYSFMYYNFDTKEQVKYESIKGGQEFGSIPEFVLGGKRLLSLYPSSGTILYDINNTPNDTSDDSYGDYATKEGFQEYASFRFIGTDSRNNNNAFFALVENGDSEDFIIWIDTKGTFSDVSDDTYVTWGVSDNIFYMGEDKGFHTTPNFTGSYFDQELNILVLGSYTDGTFLCTDSGDPMNKTNDSCRYIGDMTNIFSIIKDPHGYYWLAGDNGIAQINTHNTSDINDDTYKRVIKLGEEDNISNIQFVAGQYPVGDEIWYLTRTGYLKAIEYNFTYDDSLDDTKYSYRINNLNNRIGGDGKIVIEDKNTMYVVVQGGGLQKISLTRSFESQNIIEMLPIPPDGILAINYIDLEEVLGSVTNGSLYTLNDLVSYEVSNNSGITWYSIEPGERVLFPTPDYKLKVRITLRSGSSPVIDLIKLSYIVYPSKDDDQCNIKVNSQAPVITDLQNTDNNSINIDFTPIIDNSDVTKYILQYGPSVSEISFKSLELQSTATSYTLENITKNTQYHFRIKAITNCTESDWSEVLSILSEPETEEKPVKQPTLTSNIENINLCGNGILDNGEQCEYTNSETYMCEDGTYAQCTTDCKLSTESCKKTGNEKPTIIDNIKETIEEGEATGASGISISKVIGATVKVFSISLFLLSTPLMPYYFTRTIIGLLYAVGKKKRNKEYGYVYDSVSKEPINQAIVRVYDDTKLIYTDVTGTYGEFGGKIPTGEYRISVVKPQYTFPSTIVTGTQDRHISNIYNGILKIKDNSEIITAIPIDYNKTNLLSIFKTIVIDRTSILFQVIKFLLFIGLLGYSIYAYRTTGTTFNLIVLIEYIIVAIIYILSLFNKEIQYGKVTNIYNEEIDGINIGLFETEFGKLEAERVTDKNGQYRFVVKPGSYEIKSLDNRYTISHNEKLVVSDQPSIINKNLKADEI